MLQYGAMLGIETAFVAVAAGRMDFNIAYGHPTALQQGFMTACFPVFACLGSLLGLFLASVTPLRWLLVVCTIIWAGGYVVTCVLVSFNMFLVGRMIKCTALGVVSSTIPLYIRQVFPIHRAQYVLASVQGLIPFGVFFTSLMFTALGSHVSFTHCWFITACPVISVIITCFLGEKGDQKVSSNGKPIISHPIPISITKGPTVHTSSSPHSSLRSELHSPTTRLPSLPQPNTNTKQQHPVFLATNKLKHSITNMRLPARDSRIDWEFVDLNENATAQLPQKLPKIDESGPQLAGCSEPTAGSPISSEKSNTTGRKSAISSVTPLINLLRELRLLSTPGYRRPFGLAIATQVLVQLTGVNIIMYYMPFICLISGLSAQSTAYTTLGLYGFNFTITLCSLAIINRFDRTFLLKLGCFILAIIHGGIFGLMITGKPVPPIDGNPSAIWHLNQVPGMLVIALCFLFVLVFGLLVSGTSMVYTSEIVPEEIQTTAVSLAIAIGWLANFCIAVCGPPMLATIKYAAFAAFSVICCFLAICLIRFDEPTSRRIERVVKDFKEDQISNQLAA